VKLWSLFHAADARAAPAVELPGHIIVRFQNSRSKERITTASREKNQITHNRSKKGFSARHWWLTQAWEAETGKMKVPGQPRPKERSYLKNNQRKEGLEVWLKW
jgi:hypothetical protein